MNTVTIIWPKAGQPNYQTADQNQGDQTGCICVQVLAQDDTGGDAQEVRAINYTAFANIPPMGTPPPPGAVPLAPHATLAHQWMSHDVCDVPYGTTGSGVQNFVAVWAIFPPNPWEGPFNHMYFALLADDVLCGSGSGSGSFLTRTIPSTVALTHAPLEWNVDAKGFYGAAKLFTGKYKLKFRNDTLDACVWDNRDQKPPRSKPLPFVELRCEIPAPITWRLTLKHRNIQVEYTRAAFQWHPLGGPNTLLLASSGTLPPASLPKSIGIKPA